MACAVEALVIERSDVVDGGPIVWCECVGAGSVGVVGVNLTGSGVGFRIEIVEAADELDERGELGGDGERRGVGEVLFVVDTVATDGGVECGLELGDGAAAGDPIAATSYGFDGEALGFQPSCGAGDVGG